MIVVSDFRKQELPGTLRVICSIRGEGFRDGLYFDVHPDNAAAVELAEPNWAAVALLYPAMLMGRDLVIEADLSPLLLNNLRGDFMALVRNFEPKAKAIRIEAGATCAPAFRHAGKRVVTGMSFGVDSTATFLRYTRPEVPEAARLTGAAVFQVGAFGPTGAPSVSVDPARRRCEEILGPLGIRSYSLGSNMDSVFAPAAAFGQVDFMKTVGFRNAAAALVFQKEIGFYLASSNVDYSRATFGQFLTTENLDPAFQPLLNTEAMQFQSALAGTTRFDKIVEIADSPLAQHYLDVCVGPIATRFISTGQHRNCSRCWKCALTMLALESIGKLEGFAEVFDLDLYRREKAAITRMAVDFAELRGPLSASRDIIRRCRQEGLALPRPTPVVVQKGLRWVRWRLGGAARGGRQTKRIV